MSGPGTGDDASGARQAGTPAGSGFTAAGAFVGEPDDLQRLWTPHRMVYVGGEAPHGDADGTPCPFCEAPSRDDATSLVVVRAEHAYVVLNLYPYNTGHLLVCPHRHVADYTNLTERERAEVAALTQEAMRVVRAVSGPAGFNIGMNQGEVAGAGIAGHLHQHVVPRWRGDANFFPIVARTKALPQLLGETRELLAAEWHRLTGRATTQREIPLPAPTPMEDR